MIKKCLVLFLVCMMVLSSVVACSQNQDSATASGNNSLGESTETQEVLKEDLTVAISADIASLDPQGHNDTKSELVTNVLFNRLFRLNQDFGIDPDLAEEWSQPSPTEWVIKIKEGVKFHDGSEMKASDVKFSFERSKEMPKVQHVLAEMDTIEVVDDYTVKITTKTAFAPFLYTLAHAGASIIPEAYVNAGGNFDDPIGTGPYKFVSWASGDKIVVEKFDGYFDENNMGHMKKITFRVIPEGTSRTIALETGEVDLVQELETIDMPKVEEAQNLSVYTTESTRVDFFAVNNEKPPFDNKLVRQALNYAIDKQAIMIVAINGAGAEAKSVLAPSMLGYKGSDYSYDPEKAKALLAEAGFENGFEMTIWASGDERKRIAEVIQANLLEVGITASIEMYEWATYIDLLMKGEEESLIIGWSSNPDPDQTLTPLYHSSNIGGFNFSRINDSKIDELIETARVEMDLDKRIAMYNEFHEYIMDEAPIVPLFVKFNVVGANAALKDVELSPQGLFNLEKIHY
ncbi:glutathione ABC transporter substrate-binding protein [Acidaminobacter sp. JC074]|uniref:ABC transporter substrate-binding protein n=1 Tax=Acidaminobacter sp. JC074 TaxID=2530199 RepID=UPI001F0DF495|nr:ABC transporter substrate-binding protein [Acidaminobacter sp. JC074]MCH4889025.1 glutathione ABC transporter substrate-binding protein [Acidaminobacter sp. JC074]